MVTALKVSATPCLSRLCSTAGAIGASVKTKDSMVAMSGAIMPAPLAMPQMVTGVVAEPHHGGGALRKGVGGHDRLGRLVPGAGRGVGDQLIHDAAELRRIERLADHAGRGQKDLATACSRRPRRRSRR